MNTEKTILDDIAVSDNITQDMTEVPSAYAYWSSRLNELKFKYEEAELNFKIWLATKKQEIADEAMRAGGKKDMTETAKEAAVMSKYKDAYIAMASDILKLQKDMETLKSGVKTIELKSEMLISIGANFRQEREMTAGMSIRDRQKS